MTNIRKYIFSWIFPLLLALFAFALSRLNVFEDLERHLLDARFKLRGPRSIAATPFQIVAVDDQTFSILQEKWPFRASLYAHLVENLNRAGARLIVFDIEFAEPNPLYPAADTLFAKAIEKAGNVILSGKIAYTHDRKFEQPYAVPVPPLPILQAAGAPWGITNEITDSDDFTRRYLLYLPFRDRLKPSLGLEVLRAWRQFAPSTPLELDDARSLRFGSFTVPLCDRQSFLINYYGPAGTFPAISFSSVLDDSSCDLAPNDANYMERFLRRAAPGTPQEVANPFVGKVILIGASAEELHDTKNTPFYASGATPHKMSGVEMHAHALQTILDQSFIRRSSPLQNLLLILILSIIIFYSVDVRRPWRGLLASLILLGAIIVAAYLAFARWNYWIDMTAPLLCALLAYLGTFLYHYFRERRRRTRIQDMFSRYVPNQVVKELIEKPQLLKLGGERRRLTVLFSDIWDFTSVSEKLPPELLVIHLNDYMTAMTEIILANSGIIDKYEGDLIMAEFGAPVHFDDHCARACRAALQMQQRLSALCQKWTSEGKPALSTRIGINTGDVIVGNMGSRDVFDYTVLGDAVNLCSRLEKANKYYGTGILISQTVRDDLPAAFLTRPLDDLRVRGRSEPVRIYELMTENDADVPSPQRKLLELYQQGWSLYQARDWSRARKTFESCLSLQPDDRPSQILLERCRQFESEPPEPTWDGAFAINIL